MLATNTDQNQIAADRITQKPALIVHGDSVHLYVFYHLNYPKEVLDNMNRWTEAADVKIEIFYDDELSSWWIMELIKKRWGDDLETMNIGSGCGSCCTTSIMEHLTCFYCGTFNDHHEDCFMVVVRDPDSPEGVEWYAGLKQGMNGHRCPPNHSRIYRLGYKQGRLRWKRRHDPDAPWWIR